MENQFWDWDELPGQNVYSEEHRDWRATIRRWMDRDILPNIDDWEEEGDLPKDLAHRSYEAGQLPIHDFEVWSSPVLKLGCRVSCLGVYGAGYPKKYGGQGPEPFNIYHAFILYDELGRGCAGGLHASLLTHGIGLPPLPNVGKKKICLAITEPTGGSDVANIRTTAIRDHAGFFIVNGNKTFISGGMNADFFTTAVRTDPNSTGYAGISLVLVERRMPGVKTTRLRTQGWNCSTTTAVAFDDVKVPIENLIGEEGMGFVAIMLNFNNERFSMAVTANRMSRCCLEEAIKYASQRETFGKKLVKHQVIRHKLMECARHIIATNAMIMSICAQMQSGVPDTQLGGLVALCKVQATKTMEFVARETFQVFGGKAYLRGGVGGTVERVYREVRVYAIGGGSEEIMLDLASRQAKL